MAQLNATDKFIVDRNGSTYKTTFEDIQESLNIVHDFTGVVDETVGGTILAVSFPVKGTKFIVGQEYVALDAKGQIDFVATEVDDDGGLVAINILSNDPVEIDDVFVANPIILNGSLDTVSLSSLPGLGDGSSASYFIRQSQDILDENNESTGDTDLISEGKVTVTNNNGTLEVEVIIRGGAYVNGVANLEVYGADGLPQDGPEVTITTIDPPAGDLAQIKIDGVASGADEDNAILTVELGGVEKQVKLIPGEGISFSNGNENEIMITNTSTSQGGGDSSTGDGTVVIVDEIAPSIDVYPIKDGSLWYNLLEGRLYVAVTYVTSYDPNTGASTSGFDWIDASPSSFNDALRKNQDDSTNYKIDVNNSLYATHFALERLPLIS